VADYGVADPNDPNDPIGRRLAFYDNNSEEIGILALFSAAKAALRRQGRDRLLMWLVSACWPTPVKLGETYRSIRATERRGAFS
jgi:hypothetical protein